MPKKTVGVLWFLLLIAFFPSVVAAADTFPDLPEMTFKVESVDGSASWHPDTTTEWMPLEEDQELDVGDHVRTGDDGSVELTVPGVNFVELKPGAEVKLTALNRDKRTEGLITEEKVIVNKMSLESKKGKVQNSLRRHEGVRNDYSLKTPQAVAGVRGTTFSCESDPFEETVCAVLDGEIELHPPGQPERARRVGAGQQSRVREGANRASEPEQISEEQQEQLNEFKQQAQKSLQLPPTIDNVSLNGQNFQQSIRLKYPAKTELTLAGNASAREDDHEVESVSVSRADGGVLAVEGTTEWSTTFSPAPPEAGGEKTITLNLTARDDQNLASEAVVREIVLFNPVGEGTDSVLPQNYESGDVPIEVSSIAGGPVDALDFPYHLYKEDLDAGELTLRGTVETDRTVEGIAYSLDGGSSWTRLTGSGNFTAGIPLQQSGEFSVQFRAWTADGVLGEPVEVGPFWFHNQTQTTALRQLFDKFWQAFENENSNELLAYLDGNFQRKREEGDLDRSQYGDRVKELFDRFENLRIEYTINNNQASPNGGEINSQVVWEGQFLHEDSERNRVNNPFVVRDNGDFKFVRTTNGRYKFLSFENFKDRIFYYTDRTLTLKFRDGLDILGLEREDNQSLSACGDPHAGQVIAGLNGGACCYYGVPAALFRNPCQFCTAAELPWQVDFGGVTQLSATSFSQVTTIPPLDGGGYKKKIEFGSNTDNLFAFIINRSATDNYVTGVFEIVDSTKIDSNTYESITIRVLSTTPTEEEPFREYGGVDPF